MSPLEIRGSQKNTSTLEPDTTATDTSVGANGICPSHPDWYQHYERHEAMSSQVRKGSGEGKTSVKDGRGHEMTG